MEERNFRQDYSTRHVFLWRGTAAVVTCLFLLVGDACAEGPDRSGVCMGPAATSGESLCPSQCHVSGDGDPATIEAEGIPTFLGSLLDTSDFPARWQCGNWHLEVGWIHIASDVAIFAAYFAIPVVLFRFVRARDDFPVPSVVILFSLFILACGLGHLLEATMFWWPAYRLSGLVKLVTALVSWGTVAVLAWTLPYLLSLPGLSKLNRLLENEIAERREAQERLQSSYEELRNFSSSAIDREERVIELKKEVNSLLDAIGKPRKYNSVEIEL
ncbi:hypothetical protein C5Y97_10770 [Blastopirellula marina]|uniref:Ethylene receptor 1-like N-terminal domain-containing protein n=1 Tax=Blastopirellula marina TaxID=124 RepID=A0A2S8G306_9BACT|nr:hypothetical protein C5Y98_10760 [Blastopirellula marina]PTL45181.1 hypothetical protein C5Y97_10770 [Blastopirellula marina]